MADEEGEWAMVSTYGASGKTEYVRAGPGNAAAGVDGDGTDGERYDAIIIGSGFGGALTADQLVRAGWRVLMLERGGWVEPEESGNDDVWDFFQLGAGYEQEYAAVVHGRRTAVEGLCACVGGASAFYGGVSLRMREGDFAPGADMVAGSGADWPIDYATLEPYYTAAEQMLNVAGEAGADPTEPFRSAPYPRAPAALAPISQDIDAAARRLGLHPSRVPLALDESCTDCTACDGYPAAGMGRVVRALLAHPGFTLRTRTAAVGLRVDAGRIAGVESYDRESGTREILQADTVVLSAGALASPQLLLASGLERLNPGGAAIGRYLMRHCNAFVYGAFPRLRESGRHHKQIAIHDFYTAQSGGDTRRLGSLQQVMHPQLGGVLRLPAQALRRYGSAAVRLLADGTRPLAHRLSGLQVVAADQPQARNRIELDRSARDEVGLPRLRLHHEYTDRDLASRATLIRHAREILTEAGALFTFPYRVKSFSHAVGTVRMGRDPRSSALDEHCRFRGVDNLYVVDGSFLPTSAAVNPSLTIAANAIRVGARLALSVRN